MAADLPGHGASAPGAGDYSLGALAAGLRDLLVVLGHERATLVGHSLGGGIAMQFAYQFPEITERLVLVSSGGLGPEVSPVLRVFAIEDRGFMANRLYAQVLGSMHLARIGVGVRESGTWGRGDLRPRSRAGAAACVQDALALARITDGGRHERGEVQERAAARQPSDLRRGGQRPCPAPDTLHAAVSPSGRVHRERSPMSTSCISRT